MNLRKAFTATLLLLSMPLVAEAFSLQHLSSYENLALSDRLEQIHEREQTIIRECDGALPTTQWPTWPSALAKQQDAAIEHESLARLQLVSMGLPTARACFNRMHPGQDFLAALSPRKAMHTSLIFESVCLSWSADRGCLKDTREVWKDIEPACFHSERKGLANFFENNACFGGDAPMDEALTATFGEGKYKAAASAGYLLSQFATQAPRHSTLEVTDVLNEIAPFLSIKDSIALLAVIGTSGNSGMTGWMQSLEDRWLLESLIAGKSAAVIYGEFSALQTGKINYTILRDTVERRKLTLTLGGVPINQWNHHNLMAAFVGCHFSNLDRTNVTRLVLRLGQGYESADFVSHLLDGDSLHYAKNNFRVDTNRYRESGAIGYDLCAPKAATK